MAILEHESSLWLWLHTLGLLFDSIKLLGGWEERLCCLLSISELNVRWCVFVCVLPICDLAAEWLCVWYLVIIKVFIMVKTCISLFPWFLNIHIFTPHLYFLTHCQVSKWTVRVLHDHQICTSVCLKQCISQDHVLVTSIPRLFIIAIVKSWWLSEWIIGVKKIQNEWMGGAPENKIEI